MACETHHSHRLQLKSSIAIAFVRRTFARFGATNLAVVRGTARLDRVNQGKPKVGDVQGQSMLVGVAGLNPLTNEV